MTEAETPLLSPRTAFETACGAQGSGRQPSCSAPHVRPPGSRWRGSTCARFRNSAVGKHSRWCSAMRTFRQAIRPRQSSGSRKISRRYPRHGPKRKPSRARKGRCISASEVRNRGLAPVAQRIRASDFGSEGWGFESLRARFTFHLSKIVCCQIHCQNVPAVERIDVAGGLMRARTISARRFRRACIR